VKIKCLFILFVCYFMGSSQPCFSQLSSGESAVITEFGKQLSDDIRKDNLHGSISTAIIKNDRVIWAGAFGYARVNSDAAADTSTIYRIGSITKTFTVVILMQLVEEGKVKLDDPVENYVPEIRSLKGYSDKTKITLRQLASHTAGLEREPAKADANIGPLEEWESKTLSCIPYTSFSSSPGTQFLYSNIGFALLGLALERASGVPYIQMVKEKIFMPLHMDDTFFSMPENKMARLAQGIDNNNENNINLVRPVQELNGRGYRIPNGGIYSTPLDLSKFVIA
jgi:CubicO group peptidase (beta-lactamase class C family)